MKFVFLPLGLTAFLACAPPAFAGPISPAAPQAFHGKVYQVDTIYNNIDVIMPDRKRTFWADAATKVRIHRQRAQLIDIAMGDEVSGTYVTGSKGALMLVTIEDLAGK